MFMYYKARFLSIDLPNLGIVSIPRPRALPYSLCIVSRLICLTFGGPINSLYILLVIKLANSAHLDAQWKVGVLLDKYII